jgi:hypothetical protein
MHHALELVSSSSIFRSLVARPWVKTWLELVCGMAAMPAQPLFRVHEDYSQWTKTFTDVFSSMIASEIRQEGRPGPLPPGKGWREEGPQGKLQFADEYPPSHLVPSMLIA